MSMYDYMDSIYDQKVGSVSYIIRRGDIKTTHLGLYTLRTDINLYEPDKHSGEYVWTLLEHIDKFVYELRFSSCITKEEKEEIILDGLKWKLFQHM